MKNYFLIALMAMFVVNASGQSKWNVGIGTGAVTNISKFDSGNEEANALFKSNPYQSKNLAVNFRYKISDKLSIQTGLSFAKIGYSYSIAKDYSLIKPAECNKDDINSSSLISNNTAMVVLNTPVNCNNMRFIFGAGMSVRGGDKSWNSKSRGEVKSYEAANSVDTYITAESSSSASLSPAATWMIGMEKVLRKGNTLSFTFQGNQGFTTISKSTVNYTVGNRDYSHTFINRGSFVAFSLAYNFSPFGTRKANKLLQNSVN